MEHSRRRERPRSGTGSRRPVTNQERTDPELAEAVAGWLSRLRPALPPASLRDRVVADAERPELLRPMIARVEPHRGLRRVMGAAAIVLLAVGIGLVSARAGDEGAGAPRPRMKRVAVVDDPRLSPLPEFLKSETVETWSR